ESSTPVTLAARVDEQKLWIEVRDQGRGIAPDDLRNLFTPFFRADRSRARQTGGLGLGLLLARRIVEAHRGSLEIESAPQRGTGTSSAVSASAADGGSAADSGVDCGPGSASAAAVQACAGKAAGDACSYTDGHDTDTGNCQLASDGTTLTCVEAPSADEIAACSGKAAGDACTAPDGDAGTCQVAADATTVACFETRVSGAPAHR